MYVKFNDLIPDKQLRKELDKVYNRVMDSGIYLNGEETRLFEEEYAKFVGNEYCISLGSGYDGLLLALSIFKNYDVLVPELTIPLVYNAVLNAGCKAVKYNDDKYYVGLKVHLYGKRETTELNTVYTIGDYSQAHGLIPKEDINIWSFYPTKNLGGYGNNGAITTDDPNFYHLIRGNKECNLLNSKMDELQAGFLRVKMKYLKKENKRRKEIALLYLDGLKDLDWLTLPDIEDSVVHQFVIRTNFRDQLKSYLAEQNIETMIHYLNMGNVLSLPLNNPACVIQQIHKFDKTK